MGTFGVKGYWTKSFVLVCSNESSYSKHLSITCVPTAVDNTEWKGENTTQPKALL